MEKEQRYQWLDVLKFVLSYLIVLRHIGQSFFEVESTFFFLFSSVLSTIGVPCFFIISGFLFFRKEVTKKRLIDYCVRILKLYLVWAVIYTPFVIWMNRGADNILDVLVDISQNVLFSGFYYHLWYLSALLVAILVVCALVKHLGVKKTVGIMLFLFIVGVLGDTYKEILPEGMKSLICSYETYFLTMRNGLFFGGLYVFIGKLIADNKKIVFRQLNYKYIIIGILAGIIGIFIEAKTVVCLTGGNTANNMLIFACPLSICLVLFCIKISQKRMCRDTAEYRNLSTVIYLVHPWIIDAFVFVSRHFVHLNMWIVLICILFFTSLVAIVVVEMAKKHKIVTNLY